MRSVYLASLLPAVFAIDCKVSLDPQGQTYTGTKDTTKSGKTCQYWNSNSPNNVPSKFKNNLDSANHNFCRNPDNDLGGPWCYLQDYNGQGSNWEHCSIPSCRSKPSNKETVNYSEKCYSGNGSSYRGSKSTTASGYTCQGWHPTQWKTHKPSVKMLKKIPNDAVHNYCRNYDGDSRPWCYTTSSSKKWEYCSVPKCSSNSNIAKPATSPVESKPTTNCNPPKATTFNVGDDELRCGYRCEAGQRCSYPGEIVGGEVTEEGELPWQVHLRVRSGAGFCGGSIINKDWILTAAHCVYANGKLQRRADQLYIATGYYKKSGTTYKISPDRKRMGRDFIQAEKIIVHDCYDEKEVYNDIALIKLSRPITYGITAQSLKSGINKYKSLTRPICLSTDAIDKSTANNKKCVISGWGDTKGTNSNDKLLMAEIPMGMTNAQCERKLGYAKYLKGDNSQICALKPGTNIDTCQGDSGGPLVCRDESSDKYPKQYAQVGVTSWGFGCGEGTPGVYTRVSNYIDWIAQFTDNIQLADW